jgi:V8-like Glu-specific endopeptidase
MASDPNDPHLPVSNLTSAIHPVAEELSAPETGTESGVLDADGPIEAGGARSMTLESLGAPETALVEAPATEHLQDAGAASFDDPSLRMEAIIGVDERVRITDTASYPYRAIASLLITANDGAQFVGTGWFVSPRTLVTAGHCVYVKNSGRPNRDGWVKSIQVMPGRNGATLPYGSVTSTQFFTVKGWADNGDESYDYAAIIVPTELGSRVGWFGYGVFPDAVLQDALLNVSGYPADKRGAEQGTLWHDSRKTAALGSTKINYALDTVGGQSGAPAYMIRDNERFVVAIHAYGGAVTNSGTRINSAVMKNINAWRR